MMPIAQPIIAPQTAEVKIIGINHLLSPDPYINEYNRKGAHLLPTVVPGNQNMKNFVGEFIYDYVEKMAGEGPAPKITGMLIDLPLDDIKSYLYNF
jgi:Poly-adenylate binding protein, unique domain